MAPASRSDRLTRRKTASAATRHVVLREIESSRAEQKRRATPDEIMRWIREGRSGRDTEPRGS